MALVFLVFAAVLEVAGDALCRAGWRGGRVGLLLLGGVVLWLYGITVNVPGWPLGDFSASTSRYSSWCRKW